MNVRLQNIGVLNDTEFELGALTIITGQNNSGKTYAAYALYGFLKFWPGLFDVGSEEGILDRLKSQGTTHLDLKSRIESLSHSVSKMTTEYTTALHKIFAAEASAFERAKFDINIGQFRPDMTRPVQASVGGKEKRLLVVGKEAGSTKIEISKASESTEPLPSSRILREILNPIIAEILFGQIFPRPFIISSERTGISLFWRELDINKNILTDELRNREDWSNLNPFELVSKMISRYARPIRDNIDTTRDLPNLLKERSFLCEKHPYLLNACEDLVGGTYRLISKELQFAPAKRVGRRKTLPLYLASTSVRSLSDLVVYIEYFAKPNDLLIIDEPELNLHPRNQRKMARLLAMLVNAGIKVFLTTHSDYLIKEINNLMMLSNDFPSKAKLMKTHGYVKEEVLDPTKIRLYVACNGKLEGATVDRLGFTKTTFDSVIDEMNNVQDELTIALESPHEQRT